MTMKLNEFDFNGFRLKRHRSGFGRSLACAALLLFGTGLSAQTWLTSDRIRTFDEVKVLNSIIRDIDGENRLVLDEGYGSSYFIKVDDTNGYVPALGLPEDIRVRDFTIHEGTVYFCGYKVVTFHDTVPVFGWFGLEGFPSVSVSCATPIFHKSFERMGLYTIPEGEGQLHFALVARRHDNKFTLVDACITPDNKFRYHYMENPEELTSHYIDDLVVTDNYVVVSSRTREPYTPTGYLWCFEKPYAPGAHMFSVAAHRCPLGTVAPSRIILEKLGRTSLYYNAYVALYSGQKVEQFSLFMSEFDGIYHGCTRKLATPYAHATFKGVMYNPEDPLLSVVVDVWPNLFIGPHHHVVYTMSLGSCGGSGGSVKGYLLEEEEVHSLTYLRGRLLNETCGTRYGTLRLNTYDGLQGDCLSRVGGQIMEMEKRYKYDITPCDAFYNEAQVGGLPTTETSFRITTECETRYY